MKINNVALIGFVVAFSTNANAALVTAYDNFNYTPGEYLYGAGGVWVGNGGLYKDSLTRVGSTFTPTATGTLDSFEVGIYSFNSTNVHSITWSIFTSDGVSDDLSNQIWSGFYQNGVTQSTAYNSTSMFDVSLGPELQAGEEYWLIADVPVNGTAYYSMKANSTDVLGRLQYQYEWDRPGYHSIATRSGSDIPVYAMSITVDADVYVVPVPAAVWLFGSGLLGLIGIARRRYALFVGVAVTSRAGVIGFDFIRTVSGIDTSPVGFRIAF